MTTAALERASLGRGPDPFALRIDSWKRAVLAARDADVAALKAADDLLKAEHELREAGFTPPKMPLSREYRNLVAMRGGVPFWNRDPAEPPPALPMFEDLS
jgi:hypothetical protein